MENLKQYILAVVAASVLCGLILTLTGKKSTTGPVIKLLCGIFLSLTLIVPLSGPDLLDFTSYENFWSNEAEHYASFGQESASVEVGSIITEQCQAYILDKAASLGADIQVQIKLSQDEPPTPWEIHVTGSISPYAKGILKKTIIDELGIPEERQIWT